jgi:transcriptional regulator with XRE-family HTH domain
MASNGKPRTIFGERLRGELTRQNISIRQLARQIDPKSPEVARRNLSRWIAGTRPTKGSRVLVAHALGVDPSHFDEDDEEEDSEMADLFRALLNRIDRKVEEEIEKRLGVES